MLTIKEAYKLLSTGIVKEIQEDGLNGARVSWTLDQISHVLVFKGQTVWVNKFGRVGIHSFRNTFKINT